MSPLANGLRQLLAGGFLTAAILASCTLDASVPATAGPSAQPSGGRSVCPGGVARAATNLTGPAADAVERLQGAYQGDPGFLGVVFDGAKAAVIVESGKLSEWQTRLAPSGVAVARSCIDPALLVVVDRALPTVAPADGIVSSGYDAQEDAIKVVGVDQQLLLDAIGRISADARRAAQDAIAEGTLRVDRRPFSVTP